MGRANGEDRGRVARLSEKRRHSELSSCLRSSNHHPSSDVTQTRFRANSRRASSNSLEKYASRIFQLVLFALSRASTVLCDFVALCVRKFDGRPEMRAGRRRRSSSTYGWIDSRIAVLSTFELACPEDIRMKIWIWRFNHWKRTQFFR